MAINAIVPIRWLPVATNRHFKKVNTMIRQQITSIIKDRIRTVGARKAAGMSSNPETIKDFLTFMISEKYFADANRWHEDDILAQVGSPEQR